MHKQLSLPTRSAFVIFATLIGLSFAVVGCSSDNSPGSTSTAAAPETFRIGLEAPLSGSQRDVGKGMLKGAELAAAKLNKAGGIDGKTVKIVAIDDKADPAAGILAAKAAITDGLDAVVGPYNSGVGAKTLPLYIAAGLVPMRLTSADTTAGLGYTLQPMTSQIAPSAVTAITKWGKATSVGIIFDPTQEYTTQAAEAMQRLLPTAGVKITSSEAIKPGAKSYADAVTKVLADGPQLVYVVTYSPEAGAIAKDLAAANTGAKCLIDYGGFDNGYIAAAGLSAAQLCPLVGVPAPDDFPGSAGDVKDYRKMFDEVPGAWSPYTHDSVLLLADAVKRAGGTNPKDLAKALEATSGWKGWTGTVALEPKTGNRTPAPVTVTAVDAKGAFHVDASWAIAVGFAY